MIVLARSQGLTVGWMKRQLVSDAVTASEQIEDASNCEPTPR